METARRQQEEEAAAVEREAEREEWRQAIARRQSKEGRQLEWELAVEEGRKLREERERARAALTSPTTVTRTYTPPAALTPSTTPLPTNTPPTTENREVQLRRKVMARAFAKGMVARIESTIKDDEERA